MAIRPDYDIGSVTLTSGSSDFTTSGSSLQTAAVQAGDAIITPSGHVLIIASITGQNSGTLFLPCPPAAAGTGLALRIRFQPDGSRYQGAVRVLIDLLSSGNLEAFAALVGAAGMVPIFTGPGTLDLADPATFGIQDPNGSLGKLAALTLAANKAITTDNSGNAQQIDLGTLGRALLALASGTSGQYVQGDGTLQAKTGLPVSTAQQAALNGKLSLSGGTVEGSVAVRGVLASKGAHSASAGAPFFNVLNVGNNIDWTWYLAGWNDPGILFSYTPSGSWVSTPLTMKGATGAVIVQGAFSAGSKSFEIDHPSDPFNKDLIFMSTEAPKAGVEFWGTVRLIAGVAEVDIDAASNLTPGTFAALTQRAVPLAPNNLDGETTVRSSRIVNGKFTIFASDPNCTDEVSWHVKAERADAFIKSCEFCDPETGVLIPEREKENA